LKSLVEGPGKIPDLVKNVIELGEAAVELVKNGVEDAKAAGLNPFDAAKAAAAALKNSKTLAG
jgi:hypothetical protein